MRDRKRTAVEELKASSAHLRHTLAQELDDPAPNFGSDAAQLDRFAPEV